MGPRNKAAHDGLTGFKMYISAFPGKWVFVGLFWKRINIL